MKKVDDHLSQLFPAQLITYAERINMPYLGYHLLRHYLFEKVLGESESPMLYWLGKDLSKQLTLDTTDSLSLLFIRLGLGNLTLLKRETDRYVFELSHPLYEFMPVDRLRQTLSFESGLIAGIVSDWHGRPAHAALELYQGSGGYKARIIITS
ncbi:DUF2507 domain-containing protein [Brevibacillus fulvus]|uniref:Hydrocarbon binding protein n=1 Tax=Brevibacillus fulvus TaxID=1125967 RepID=A0A938Y1V6_9BACL|nr:DUF2507 domain-containing protein [Brevibacillus fulvus]MBM7590082.1 putative hydrocarbon binding protein [Brevibacillus fulvus]